jgi:hypothetical protein
MSLKRSLDELMNAMPEGKRSVAVQNRLPYIFSKAFTYLKMGPERYRKNDFFGQPPEDMSAEQLSLIESGCRQILLGKGLTADEPFTGLDVFGFYDLFRVLHYEKADRSTVRRPNGILDEITKELAVDGSKVVYYNLVEYDFG